MASTATSVRPNTSRVAPHNEARNVTACMACRKRKIKCHMLSSEPPCTRCRARNLACTVNQKRNDSEDQIEQRLKTVESMLLNLQSGTTQTNSSVSDIQSSSLDNNNAIPGSEQVLDANMTMSSDLTCSLGAFPASSVHGLPQDSPTAGRTREAPRSSNTVTVTPDDLLLATDTARAYFLFFCTNLDPLIFGVLNGGDSIQTVLLRSPLLAFALCTTVAYCTNTADYDTWRSRLRELVLEKTFSAVHNFDEVRACCVAAFWLDDMATVFNALAVRLASELNLHRCVTKMPHSKVECYERTRLYFLVCIVDHRCSITFGRPPLTRGIKQDISPRQLLQCPFVVDQQTDLRLISDLELWAITAKVFDNFGADIERHSVIFLEEITSFEERYDEWMREWLPVISPVTRILGPDATTTPADQVFHLSLLAAKLFLYSHVFRGPGQRQGQPPVNFIRTAELQDLASQSIKIAAQYLDHMVNLIVHSSFVEKVPSHLGLMTAYASMIIHRTSRLPDLANRPQNSAETLTRFHRTLETALQAVEISNLPNFEPRKPLVRLAQILRRQLGDQSAGQDTPLVAHQCPPDDFPPPATDNVHFHLDNMLINDSYFNADLTSMGFPSFDGNMFDWPLA